LLDYEAQEKARTRLVEDIERTRAQAEWVERTVRRGLGADKIRRYAKKVARKAKARASTSRPTTSTSTRWMWSRRPCAPSPARSSWSPTTGTWPGPSAVPAGSS